MPIHTIYLTPEIGLVELVGRGSFPESNALFRSELTGIELCLWRFNEKIAFVLNLFNPFISL